MKKLIWAFLLLASLPLAAQSFWQKAAVNTTDDVIVVRDRAPLQFQLFSLDATALQQHLIGAPVRYNPQAANTGIVLSIPTRSGDLEYFQILEAPMLSPQLAQRLPMIKTYVGIGVDDPSARLYVSSGTDGWHFMTIAADRPSVFIDPYTRDRGKYIVYSRADLPALPAHECHFRDEYMPPGMDLPGDLPENITDGLMREYNLVVATTIEYSAYHLTNQGVPGTASTATKKAAVQSAITTTINRVRGIYETELGVTFVFNDNQEDVIFIDSDNFDNDNASVLINQSQTEIDAIIGNANYDVGHTFSTGGGGLASLGGICTVDAFGGSSRKARAITGSSNPIGDPYDVDYVAHEMGHHFGANHSYNGDGIGNCTTSNAATAAEPGSGTTIMAYAGICASLNVQNNSDPYFHILSLQEISDRLYNQGNYTSPFWNQCSSNINTGNSEPIANAGSDYTIPKGTAFVLTGSATDADNDPLTYCWDQLDLEQPNVYPLVSTTTTGPLYRSLTPSTSNKRYLPKFETVFGGSLQSTWEVTPTVGRDLNFSLTVRDNRLDGGQHTSDEMLVTVSGTAGPFLVTSQTVEQVWSTGENKTITWDVAGTTTNGINTSNVEISLVDENDNTLSVLAASTPNDGSESITVPNIVNAGARIKIAAIGNIYYALNSASIAVNTTTAYCNANCPSSGSTQFPDGTTYVGFNTIDNPSSGAPAYTDFTGISTDVALGASYDLIVRVNTDGEFPESTTVWIDWDRNCSFDDPGEEYDLGTAFNVSDGPTSNSPLSITVPLTAALGETQMRVSTAYTGGGTPPATSCQQNFLGEVEDYTLNVVAALPVDWLYFRAEVTERQQVALSWATAAEMENAGFEVERSTDGQRYQTIGWVPGQGDATVYDFVDREVQANQRYFYRLKQIDFDGSFDYSEVRSVIIRAGKASEIQLYPNPTNGVINVQIPHQATASETTFLLFDGLGRRVLQRLLPDVNNSFTLDRIPPGVYFYQLLRGRELLQTDRLVVR